MKTPLQYLQEAKEQISKEPLLQEEFDQLHLLSVNGNVVKRAALLAIENEDGSLCGKFPRRKL